MQLGVLVAKLDDESNAASALEAIGDVVLYCEVVATGARYDETPAEYVSAAIRRYATLATDEDWVGLMSVVERGDNPAQAMLQRILRWAVNRDVAKAARIR